MTFPGTFWKVQNPGIQVQIFEYLKKNIDNSRSKIDFLRFQFRIFCFQIRVFQVRFSKKSAERARFKTSKNQSPGIGPNRLESVQRPRKRLGFDVFEPFSTISAKIPKFTRTERARGASFMERRVAHFGIAHAVGGKGIFARTTLAQ